MSAYMVHEEHINVMVWAATNLAAPRGSGPVFSYIPGPGAHPEKISRLDRDSLTRAGQMLVDANAASIRARYDEEAAGIYTYTRPKRTDWTAVDVLSALSCYEYQACETGTFETSEAGRFCEALRRGLISRLPGMDAAPWGIGPDTTPTDAAA